MKTTATILFLLLAAIVVRAQDIHFSQFYATPLTINPAETGNFIEDYRVGGNFKNQWPWGQQDKRFTYRTFSLYSDFTFFHNRLPGKDWMGGGIVMLQDFAGDGNLSITKVYGSIAYHKVFGREAKYYLSVGANAGLVQKRIDYDKLYFNNQWNDLSFDLTAPTGEPGTNNWRTLYFDMAAGINFSMAPNKRMRYSVGMSLNHLTRPKETFYGESDNKLGMRPVVTAMGNIRLNKKWHIEPGYYYVFQKRASEHILNLIAGYSIPNGARLSTHTLYFGTSYRVKDAVIPVIGYRFKSVKVMMNYDINLSKLTPASAAVGGFEISVVHTGFFPNTTGNRAVPCPRL
jgi:type IX secretion system PorP/SprF family membrane protein